MKRTTQIVAMLVGSLLALLPVATASAASVGEAVRAALETHPRVLASQDEVAAREHERNSMKSGYYPSVNAFGTYGRENTMRPATVAATGSDDFVELDRREMGVEVRQNLFNGFADVRTVDQHTARIAAARGEMTDTREQVASEAARAYARLVREQRVLEMAREFLAKHEDIYQKIQARSSSGVGRRADLDHAEGRVALARSNLIAAQANLRDAEANYLRVVGQVAPFNAPVPEGLDAAMPGDLDAALKAVEQGNPLLVAANAEVDAAQSAREASNGAFYPVVDLVADRHWNRDIAGIEGKDESYGVYVQVRMNLLNGGGDQARKSAATSRLSQAQDRRDDVRRQVQQDTRLAWSAYEAVNQQLDYLRTHAAASQRSRDAYTRQFEIGQRTLLDLLDTENELFEAQRDVARAEHDRLSAQYRLQALSGKLEQSLLGGS